jgi:hypothetical protein
MVSDRSNGIYRGVIAAIVGLILAGASPPTKEEKQTAASYRQETSETVATVSDKYKPHSDKYAESCYYANNHDTADLCAQWRAAIAAEKAADATTWANWISTAGAILSFVSIVLVLIALGQTRKANRLTMKANARATRQAISGGAQTAASLAIARANADAANEQVVVARESAVNQIRPWLTFKEIHTQVVSNGHSTGGQFSKGFTVTIEWENTGNSPAMAVRMYCEDVKVKELNPVPRFDQRVAGVNDFHDPPATVGIGRGLTCPAKAILDDEFTAWLHHKVKWVIYARVDYKDIFGNLRQSECCCWLKSDGLINHPDGRIETKMALRWVGNQNRLT